MSKLLLLRNKSPFKEYLDSIPGLIQWPLQETSGITARARVNGTYNSAYDGTTTGATVGQVGAGNIPYAYSFDGNNDYIQLPAATLDTVFDPDNGGLFVFAKTDTWDGNTKLILKLAADNNNQVIIARIGTQLRFVFDSGGLTARQDFESGNPVGYWFGLVSWEGGIVKQYYNANQRGTNQSVAGEFIGALTNSLCVIGANNNSPSFVHNGDIAACGLFVGKTPQQSEIAEIYRRSGI